MGVKKCVYREIYICVHFFKPIKDLAYIWVGYVFNWGVSLSCAVGTGDTYPL